MGLQLLTVAPVYSDLVKLLHAYKIGHIVGPNNCVSVMQELSILGPDIQISGERLQDHCPLVADLLQIF